MRFMRISIRNLRASLLPAMLPALLGVGLCSGVAARADETVKAVWQVQDIHFQYIGFTTQYSCDSLRDKMREVLKQLAVREDTLVSVAGCTEMSGPAKNPSLRIVVAHAVPEAGFKPGEKRAELLALMQRKSKTAVPGDEPFDAVLRTVVLKSKSGLGSGAAGDCELLEQTRRFLLPKLGVKVVKDDMRCTPYQGSVGTQSLAVEVLAPVVKK